MIHGGHIMKLVAWLAIISFIVGSVVFVVMACRAPSKAEGAIKFGTEPNYTVQDVRKLMEKHPDVAARIVVPGLFPLDFVFLLCVGVFIASTSLLIAPHAALPVDPWLLVIFPVLYMIGDFTENCLVTWILNSNPEGISEQQLTIVKAVTWLKIGFLSVGNLQIISLLLFWAFRR
jgi:hypothetical protein